MCKVESMSIKPFSNDEAYGFASDVQKILDDVFEETPEFVRPFKASLDAFAQALMPEDVTSPSGSELDQADDYADAAWFNLSMAIRLMVRHPNEAVALAAMQVETVFSQFENPTRKSYSVEYGIMERLLSALRVIPEDVLRASQCLDWINELSARCDDFNALYVTRNQIQSERVFGMVKQAKAELSSRMQILVDDINYMLRRGSSPQMESLAARLNELIARKQMAMKAKRTAKSNQVIVES